MTLFVVEIDIEVKGILAKESLEPDEFFARAALERRIAMGVLDERESFKIVSVRKK